MTIPMADADVPRMREYIRYECWLHDPTESPARLWRCWRSFEDEAQALAFVHGEEQKEYVARRRAEWKVVLARTIILREVQE